MDIHNIEYAASMFFKMCQVHPEICPHDWEWRSSKYYENSKRIKQEEYFCELCGNTTYIYYDENGNEISNENHLEKEGF